MKEIINVNKNDRLNNDINISGNKQIYLFLMGWIGFSVIAFLVSVASSLLLQDSVSNNLVTENMIVNCFSYGILIICLFGIIGFNEVPKLFKKYNRIKIYIVALIAFGTLILFDFCYSFFLSAIKPGVTENANESGINQIMKSYPVLSLFFFGIIGPVCEELTYRVGLFSFCKRKSKTLAYLVTILLFSLIHFNIDFEAENIVNNIVNELLNLPYYAFAGFLFSFVYDNYGFEASSLAHVINNVFSLAAISIFIK